MGHLLRKEIENIRAEMINTGTRNGLLDKETTTLSEKLDLLMNEYELCIDKCKISKSE